MLSTDRRRALVALAAFALLALWLLRDGLPSDRVLVSNESLHRSLPWSAVLPDKPRGNRFVGDQPRLYWPYLLEAERVFAGEADPLWTSRGGGGQPFLGNISSSLLHPLTWLVAILPVERVPLVQGLLVLTLSSWFTWLFLRKRGLSQGASAFGAVAFGFGGHQVLWLQYALAHTLVALPFCFWAIERLVERRSRPRQAWLALGLALLVVGGHPETGYVAGLVAGLWALYRLWDHHGRWVVGCAAALALMLSALQWLPFLEYARLSNGLRLREVLSSQLKGGVTLGAALVFTFFVLAAYALLKAASQRGISRTLGAVVACVIALVMARRMGMAISAGTLMLPQLYGDPSQGGVFTAAQDYPGLNAGFSGVLPPVLLAVAMLLGVGGGFVRFFATLALLLWGAAFQMPGVESAVRAVPGLSEVGSTRLLGPVGFLCACGGAHFLNRLCSRDVPAGLLAATGRVAATAGLALLVTFVALRVPVDPHGGRTIVSKLRSPDSQAVHDGDKPIRICFDLEEPVDDLRVTVDGMSLSGGPANATRPDRPLSLVFLPQRTEEGRHRLRVEAWRDGKLQLLADQPLAIARARSLTTRDLAMISASLMVLAWLVLRPRPRGAWVATVVVALDVLTLAQGYNAASPVDELYARTQAVDWLRAQQPPFRVFTEGTILPPDTQVAVGVDHLLSYDNLGYHRSFQLLIEVPIDMDAFASFSFDRESVAYESPIFDLLDVRYVLTSLETDLSDIPGMERVHASELAVWQNHQSLGRAFLVGHAVDVSGQDRQTLATLDLTQVALLEGPVPEGLAGLGGSALVLAHRGGEIEVAVEAEGAALLVVAENGAPGWEASVDGGPFEPTRPAYVAWQAIPVPAGEHTVLLRYAPASVRWGAILSVAGLLLWLLMVLLPRRFS